MGVSLLTALMVAGNPTEIIEGPNQRLECWIVKNGQRHALVLSAPLDKREELEEAVATLKRDYGKDVEHAEDC